MKIKLKHLWYIEMALNLRNNLFYANFMHMDTPVNGQKDSENADQYMTML